MPDRSSVFKDEAKVYEGGSSREPPVSIQLYRVEILFANSIHPLTPLIENPRRRSTVNRPHTRATANSSVLSSSDDPEGILRRRRRALRSAKTEDRDVSHHQGDNNKADPETPELPESDPLGAFYESIRYLSPHFAESEESDRASSDSADEDPLVSLYKSIGYLPPLDESTLDLLEQVLLDPSMGKTGGRINPTDQESFRVGLGERNVALEPYHDPYLDHIQSLTSKTPKETQLEKRRHVRAWELDLQKTRNDPLEPVFQRTIMMSMIDRHRLLYDREDATIPILDFSVERIWKCPPMPSRVLFDPQPKCLTQPKADLALAFRQFAIFQRRRWHDLPDAMRSLLCYEGQATGKEVRVLHFMTIEGKNSFKTPDDEVALSQNLNNASQSLHNMYEFFREAGDEHVQIFFEKVRFFSCVSTSKGIKIRVHRACCTQDHQAITLNGQLGEVPPMDSIVEGYPLQFVFDDYFEASGPDFTRDKVVGAFEKIMVGYAIGELLGYLREAAKAVEAKCLTYKQDHGKRLWRDISDYMHGLPVPRNEPTPSLASQASFSTQATHRRFAGLAMSSQRLDASQPESTQGSGFSLIEPMVGQVTSSFSSRKRQRTD
ncbi:hypothetical protein M406DRAFT_71500 [Cryphonectria parasitica EP155]|uniref:Uncharacterized protein n=1 Tax=Cryphonectria parasitica (strain ATCC 38755 / EP155) TaxID=660469 RepID=A0A9P4Y7S8_CRYP1|nr:uncharacterized protein M406DRAFT_71500 [Cryphonectria parasitica EP155]KAF3768502.1 hypothetical protein M406DRAFT_71500 [Cryphonectria parasitica EP155]